MVRWHAPYQLHIAGALLQVCLEWAVLHQVAVVRLAVVTEDLPAIQCYLRLGFSVYGVEPMSTVWQGRYQDELLMYRRLDGG